MDDFGFMVTGACIGLVGFLMGFAWRGFGIFEQRLKKLFEDDEYDDVEEEYEDPSEEDYDYEVLQRLRAVDVLPWEYPDVAVQHVDFPVLSFPVLSAEEYQAQRKSFAYGNVNMHNSNVTREMVDEAARDMADEIRDRR